MWLARGWTDRDPLSRYWNALVRGAGPDELAVLAAALDAEQLAVIERLRGRQTFRPDPEFVSRLEQDLLREVAPLQEATAPLGVVIPSPADGAFPPRSGGLARTRPPAPNRWSWAPLATALLVLITLVAAYVAFIPRWDEPDTLPIFAPETPGTPATEASPESTPLSRTVPGPPVRAEFVWSIGGPESTGTTVSSHLAVDPSGNLWVMDGANGRFEIFAPDGEQIETWGEFGTGEGQFAFQNDLGRVYGNVSFSPDGDFYVADSQNARIQQFAADRGFIRAWGGRGTGDGQFLEPVSAAVSSDGSVWVLDAGREDVQIFAADGTFVRKFGGHGAAVGQFSLPNWGGFDQLGHYWVVNTGNHRLQQFNAANPAQGQHTATIGDTDTWGFVGIFNEPLVAASDRDGRMYVIDRGNPQVKIADRYGRFSSPIDGAESGGTFFEVPASIAIDGDDNLYVLDDNGTTVRVQKFHLTLP